MQDWVLKQGSKIVCQIALKRRIHHIHSSHFLVFQISNGWSLWKVASANMQYLLFKGIWHWFFFFFSFFFYLKNPESPRNSLLLSQSLSSWALWGGDEAVSVGDGGFWEPRGWGCSTILLILLLLKAPSATQTLRCPGTHHRSCSPNAGPHHEEVVLVLLGGFVWALCRRWRRKNSLTVTQGLRQPWCFLFSSGWEWQKPRAKKIS